MVRGSFVLLAPSAEQTLKRKLLFPISRLGQQWGSLFSHGVES